MQKKQTSKSDLQQVPFIKSAPLPMLCFDDQLVINDANDAFIDLLNAGHTDVITRPLSAVFPQIERELDNLLRRSQSIQLNDADSEHVKLQGSALVIWQAEPQLFVIAVTRQQEASSQSLRSQVSAGNRQEKEKQLQAEIDSSKARQEYLMTRAAQQTLLAAISDEALAGNNLANLFSLTVKELKNQLPFNFAAIARFEGNMARLDTQVGLDPDIASSWSIESERLLSKIARREQTAFPLSTSQIADLGFSGLAQSGVASCVLGKDQPFGALIVLSDVLRDFSDEDLIFFEAVGHILATAIERKRIGDQLAEATHELQRSNEDLQQFAYAAAHDLQEPLRSVVSYLDLLAERYAGQLDERGTKFIDTAVNGARRMQALITDLLQYSRIGTAKQPLELTDLNRVFNHVLSNLQASIAESNAQIEADNLPTVTADSLQMAQLFQNLLSNAIKFRSASRPQIKLSVKRAANEWLFELSDNGIGFSMEYADRIFIIFQRLHGRTKYGGTGIGLALCKRIIDRHRGRLWVESKEGEGTSFFFTLPIVQTTSTKR
jgi:signal transduction histidine kinase